MSRILVVEDESHLASGLQLNLELEGFEVVCTATARDAMAAILDSQDAFDAIVLDVMLPDVDGFEVCRRLRRAGNLTPVLMLTARAAAADRVEGLDAGADDYLVKPFELGELLARVRSLLRRRHWDSQPSDAPASFGFGRVHVDFRTRSAYVDQELVPLTHLEFELLSYFIEHRERVIPRDELLEKVWKLQSAPNTRTVDNFIVRLRRYFEPDPRRPVHFLSRRGAGYRFVP